MKPISLALENFRSFHKTKSPITFSNAQLVAILGKTGAGKSSLLEAILFALYGESSWDGRSKLELITNEERAMSVVFTFAVDGEQYVVTRVVRRVGQGLNTLKYPTGVVVDGASEVSAAIEKLLHISVDTFKATVLLPQGQYTTLLTAKDAIRQKLLGTIFGLGEIGDIDVIATRELRSSELLATIIQRERDKLPTDLTIAITTAEEYATAAVKHADALRTAKGEATALSGRIASADQTIAQLRVEAATLQHGAGLRRAYNALSAEHARLWPDLQNKTREVDAAEMALKAAHTVADELARADVGIHQLTAVRSAIDAYKRSLESRSAARDNEARAQEQLSNANGAHEAAVSALATLSVQQSAGIHERASLMDDGNRLKDEIDRLDRAIEELRRTEIRLQEAQASMSEREQKLIGARDRLSTLDGLSAQLEAELAHATAACEAAFVVHGAAAISRDLHEGDVCPICDRILLVGFEPKHSPDLAQREDERARADKCLQQHCQRLDAIKVTISVDTGELAREQRECGTLAGVYKDAFAKLGDVTQTRDPNTTIIEWAERRAAIATCISNLDSVLLLRGRQIEAEQAAVAVANAQIVSCGHRITEEHGQEARHAAACETARLSLPRRFAPAVGQWDVKAIENDLDACILSATQAAGDLTSAQTTLREEREARDREKLAYLRLVEGPRNAIIIAIDQLADKIGVLSAVFERDAPWSEYVAWIEPALSAYDARFSKLCADTSIAQTDRDALDSEMASLEARHGGAIDVAFQDALLNVERTANRTRELNEQKRRADELDGRIGALQPVARGLKDLKVHLGALKFRDYVMKQRQVRLAALASRYLLDMTNNQYTLTDDFQIKDWWGNLERDPRTLSGGEKFLASLALSLAVVEQAANTGAKIESLFLDEGFAALDSEALETAMLELRKRARHGRSIYIITHLKEAAEYSHESLVVSRTPEDGSTVEAIEGPIDDELHVEGLLSVLAL